MIELRIRAIRAGFQNIMVLLFLLTGYDIAAQMTNIELEDNLNISKLYGGLNSKVLIPVDTINPTNSVTFRVGAEAILKLNKIFRVKTLGVLQLNSNRPSNSITAFEFISQLHKKVLFKIGLMPGPVTKLRPNPATWPSQTELYAQSRLIGARPGAFLRLEAHKKLFMIYGVFEQDGFLSNQLLLKLGRLDIAGFYRADHEYFITLNYTKGDLKIITNYSSQLEEFALGAFLPITKSYTAYIDGNYLIEEDKMTYGAIGVRRYFSHSDSFIAGFLALEYEAKSKVLSAQLLVHLN